MSQLGAAARLIRVVDVVLIAALVIVGGTVATSVVTPQVIFAAVSTACVAAGGYAINDWCDVEIDRVNKPYRPLPAGKLARSQALALAVVLQIVGVTTSLALNLTAIGLIGAATVLVNLYCLRLRRLPFAGNLTTASLLTLAFIVGGIAENAAFNIQTLSMVIFLSNLAREMIKDVEDIPGDRRHRVYTLAVVFGPRTMAAVASLLFLGAAGLLFEHRLVRTFNVSYLWVNALVVTPMSLVMAVRLIAGHGASAAWARGWSKVILGAMLAAVICGLVRVDSETLLAF
jgi:geranylgeranylglycerol-phosphate geranylgeranyltransferase